MSIPCFGAVQLLAAFTLDLIFGDPLWMPHPIRWIGLLIGRLEKKLYPSVPEKPLVVKIRGIVLVLSVIIVTIFGTWLILRVSYFVSSFFGNLVAIWIAFTMLATKSLHYETMKVIQMLKAGNIDMARQQLSFLVSRETKSLDEQGILKSVLETLSENISDGVIAPLFYMSVGGPVMAVLYKTVNTLDSMVGYKNDRYIHFGWFAAKLDDVFNYIPARITAFAIVVASRICGWNWRNALLIVKRDARRLASPNAGYPQAAMAGALGVQLGGPQKYFGRYVNKPLIGNDSGPINLVVYRRAIRLFYSAVFLFLGFAVAFRYITCGF